MAGNENAGNQPGNANGPGATRQLVPLPKWSEAAEIIAQQLGAAGILGIAVIFAKPDLATGRAQVSMVISALNEDLRANLAAAVAPLIGADLSHSERKVIRPGGLV